MPNVRGLRTIKKEILKLVETYVDKAEDLAAVRQQMVPPLLEAILTDYNRNVPGARDAEVLKAISVIITKLSVSLSDGMRVGGFVPRSDQASPPADLLFFYRT